MNPPLAAPALLESARRLAAALPALQGRGQAAALLTRLAADLGPGCYPLLLKLFCIVGESRDLAARRQLALALGDLLRAGALPAGPLNGWGEADAPAFARSLFGAASRRKLDPIAYLCAWFSQTTDRPLRVEFERFPWRKEAAAWKAWTRGRTGYPLAKTPCAWRRVRSKSL